MPGGPVVARAVTMTDIKLPIYVLSQRSVEFRFIALGPDFRAQYPPSPVSFPRKVSSPSLLLLLHVLLTLQNPLYAFLRVVSLWLSPWEMAVAKISRSCVTTNRFLHPRFPFSTSPSVMLSSTSRLRI